MDCANARKGKNVLMLNFACLAASLLLSCGVGAGSLSSPTRLELPQYVNGAFYAGYDTELLADLNLSLLRTDVDVVASDELFVPVVDEFIFSFAVGSQLYETGFWNDDSPGANVLKFHYYIDDTVEFEEVGYYEDLNNVCFPLNVYVSSAASSLAGSVVDLNRLMAGDPILDGDDIVGYVYWLSFYQSSAYSVPYWVAGNASSIGARLMYSDGLGESPFVGIVGGVRYLGYDGSFLESARLSLVSSAGTNVLSDIPSPTTITSNWPNYPLSRLQYTNTTSFKLLWSTYSLFSSPDETTVRNYCTGVSTLDSIRPVNLLVLPVGSTLNLNLELSLLGLVPSENDGYYHCTYGYAYSALVDVPTWVVANSIVDGVFAYTPSYEGSDITETIGDGLGAVGELGAALSDGFDSLALENGSLSNVMAFGFILLGLGISVGIVKKCFNWITGRHGM